MARPKNQIIVITKKDNPAYVKVVGNLAEALETTGPDYAASGYTISAFERVQETYYAAVDLAGGEKDKEE
jgi:hypothetical protein